jgi:hypothetical protein
VRNAAAASPAVWARRGNNPSPFANNTNSEYVPVWTCLVPSQNRIYTVNVNTLQHGYICWVDGAVAGEIMTPITNPLPELGALPVYSKPWQRQEAAQLVCLNGEDEGLQVLLQNNSKGFHDAFAALLDEIIKRVEEGAEDIYPVVTLGTSSYKHKEYGTVYKPVLQVVGWRNNEPKAEPEPEEEPAPRRRRRR